MKTLFPIKFSFLFVIFFSVSSLFAQNKFVLDSLIIVWETENNEEKKVDISEALFNELLKGDYSKAMDFAKTEFAESKASDFRKMKTYACNHIAIVYNTLGNSDSANFYFAKALDLCEQNDFEHEKYITYINVEELHNDNYVLNKSSSRIFKVLKYFEKTNNKEFIAKSFNLIGWSYLNKREFDKALEYFNKALNLYKLINNKEGMSACYNYLGSVNFYKKEHEKAGIFFEKALKTGRGTYNNNLDAIIYFNLSRAYQRKGDFDNAKQNILKAVQLDKNSNNKRNLAYDYNSLGSLYINSDSLEKAEYYIENAYNTGKEINEPDIIHIALTNLTKLCYENKNYKKAYDYQLLINEMDSIYPWYKRKSIAQSEMQYRLEKQQYQYELSQQKRKYQNIILVGSLIIGLIILGLLYFIKSGKAKKNRLEKELLREKLEQKNKELTTYVMYLINKNELISSISKQLIKIKLNINNKESITALNEIINEIQLSLKVDTWKEFEIRFQEVHLEFYDKLAQKYPALTVNERRLSAFLKLNMTTKEISAITYQSISAIEMARTRLRKKLGIDNSETKLVAFFAKI
jgi:tetratricopeptide (TPR) repeat protein/DNA-binding CsgD family transcriptional regulator